MKRHLKLLACSAILLSLLTGVFAACTTARPGDETQTESAGSEQHLVDLSKAYVSSAFDSSAFGSDFTLPDAACVLPKGYSSVPDRNQPAEREITVPLLNETKAVRYQSTVASGMHLGLYHLYHDNTSVYCIDEKTDELVKWIRLDKAPEVEAVISDEELEAKAFEKYNELKELFGIRGEYEFTKREDKLGYCMFIFSRMVSSLASPECLAVTFLPDGTFCEYDVSLINLFENVELPADYAEQSKQAGEKCLKELFEAHDYEIVSIDWQGDCFLNCLKDDRGALCREAKLTLRKPGGTELITDLIQVALPVTEASV